jgi:hypothetical protein
VRILRQSLIANDIPIIALPDRVKPDITSVIRSPMELTYEHMPCYNLRQRRGDWRQGPWQEQERTYEYRLHITRTYEAVNKLALRTYEYVMKTELQLVIDKKVWTAIVNYLTSEERVSIIPSSIFLKEKFKPTGEFDKLKTRLIAGCHRQDKLIYQEVI